MYVDGGADGFAQQPRCMGAAPQQIFCSCCKGAGGEQAVLSSCTAERDDKPCRRLGEGQAPSQSAAPVILLDAEEVMTDGAVDRDERLLAGSVWKRVAGYGNESPACGEEAPPPRKISFSGAGGEHRESLGACTRGDCTPEPTGRCTDAAPGLNCTDPAPSRHGGGAIGENTGPTTFGAVGPRLPRRGFS
mmetsp:Transcript_65606/g.182456  ORF Transcript_65606/g.182456 Transcript_65606/m.182456 type:complete len:190 (-) Transcript_65606:166-735(-)